MPRVALAPIVRNYRISPGKCRRELHLVWKVQWPGTPRAPHAHNPNNVHPKWSRMTSNPPLRGISYLNSREDTGLYSPDLSERMAAEQSVSVPRSQREIHSAAKQLRVRSANVRPGPHPPHARHLPSYECGVPHAILRGAARRPWRIIHLPRRGKRDGLSTVLHRLRAILVQVALAEPLAISYHCGADMLVRLNDASLPSASPFGRRLLAAEGLSGNPAPHSFSPNPYLESLCAVIAYTRERESGGAWPSLCMARGSVHLPESLCFCRVLCPPWPCPTLVGCLFRRHAWP